MIRLLVCVAILLILRPAGSANAQQPGAPAVDERLVGPLQYLNDLADRDGNPYPAFIESLAVNLAVAPLPTGHLAQYDRRMRRITVAKRALEEDGTVIATIVVHELEHVRDKDQLAAGAVSYDCIDLEVRAFEMQSAVWRTLHPDLPARTPIERELSSTARLIERRGMDGLREAVARVPFYQQSCA